MGKVICLVAGLLPLLVLATALSPRSLRATSLNELRFAKTEFYFKALSSAAENSSLGKLSLSEPLDANFSLALSGKGNELFFIEPENLQVKARNLKGTQGTFRLRVNLKALVNDRDLTTSCLLTIEVSDGVNRRPVFDAPLYSAQVVENNAPDTLVARVGAQDGDYGENGRLTYHLVSSANSTALKDALYNLPFQIKSDTGDVYAKKGLNRELKDFYTLYVMAIDNGTPRLSTVVSLGVRVLPLTDTAPRFVHRHLDLVLPENCDFSLRPVVLNVSAIDCDGTSSVLYSLLGSLHDLNTFEMEATSGSLRLVSRLNHELKSIYKMSVMAKDMAQPPRASLIPLTISIINMNSNPPSFSAPFYSFQLFEDAPIGSFVGKVSASHRSATLEFSIWSEAKGEMFPFKVDPSDGTIKTVQKVHKTRKNGYELYATAHGKERGCNATVKVKIRILDMNDNVPELSRPLYRINVSEESAVGLPLLALNVLNREPNSLLDYSIEAGNEQGVFGLAKQGNDKATLTIERAGLNYRKKSSYELVVKVSFDRFRRQ